MFLDSGTDTGFMPKDRDEQKIWQSNSSIKPNLVIGHLDCGTAYRHRNQLRYYRAGLRGTAAFMLALPLTLFIA